jgi:hypothetical protein
MRACDFDGNQNHGIPSDDMRTGEPHDVPAGAARRSSPNTLVEHNQAHRIDLPDTLFPGLPFYLL